MIAATIDELAKALDLSPRSVSTYLAAGMRAACQTDDGYEVAAAIAWKRQNVNDRRSRGRKSQLPASSTADDVRGVQTGQQFEQLFEVPIFNALDVLFQRSVKTAFAALEKMPAGELRDLCERQLNETLAVSLIHYADMLMTMKLSGREFVEMRARGGATVCDEKYQVPCEE